jgi:hypothetical protein
VNIGVATSRPVDSPMYSMTCTLYAGGCGVQRAASWIDDSCGSRHFQCSIAQLRPNRSLNTEIPHAWADAPRRPAVYLVSLGVPTLS